jgi:nitrilase
MERKEPYVMQEKKKLRVAVIQDSPVIMDKENTLVKVEKLAGKASREGAQFILFPEAFIPCYPRGLSFGAVVGSRTPEGRKDWARYYENSISISGPEVDILKRIAEKTKAYLAIGAIEKEAGSLYCSLLYFSPDGALLARHRKLKPTASERLIWAEGDGSTLSYINTPYGVVSGLICWENYMPLARAAIYRHNPSIYLTPTADHRPGWQSTIQHIALESRSFVLSSNQFIKKSFYPRDLACYSELTEQPEIMSRGGSAIIDPLGNYLAGPVWDKDDILIADLDLAAVIEARFDFDVCGHYARPDVFTLLVNEQPGNDTDPGHL